MMLYMNSADDSANKNSKIYEYLNNAEHSDEAYNSEYNVLNADGTYSFGKTDQQQKVR